MDEGTKWYAQYLNGDEQGFVEIVRAYRDGLMLYINGFVHNLSLAEELTEDVFVKLGVRKPKNKGGSHFKTWLYTIARHTAIDYLRKADRARTVSLDGCADVADEREYLERNYFSRERDVTVHRAMDRIKAEYRQALWLVYFEDFSYQQVAKVMGKSVHSVETLVYRARRSLKAALEKEGFVYENL